MRRNSASLPYEKDKEMPRARAGQSAGPTLSWWAESCSGPKEVVLVELYHLQHCPFSKRVRDFIEENGIKDQVEYFDVAEDSDAYKRLLSKTGGRQVPCLFIEGRPLLESEDIVAWLKENLCPLAGGKARGDQPRADIRG